MVAMASASFLQVGEGVVNQVSRVAQEIVLYLEIPSGTDVWNAGSETWKESCEAVRSISHFILLVGRPFFLAACWILLHLGRFLWEYVVVEGLYNHGLSQSKEIILAFWRFQTSLSQKEFIFEACLGSTLVALYFLRRWLQRNRYIQRARRSLNLQLQKVGRVYRIRVNQIAKVSRLGAAMIPHALFVTLAAGLSFFCPAIIGGIAREESINILSWWYPIVCTMLLLHDYAVEKQQPQYKGDGDEGAHKRKKAHDKSSSSLRRRKPVTTRQTNPSSRSKKKQKVVQSTASGISVMSRSSETDLTAQLNYWLQFWMVRGALLVLKFAGGYVVFRSAWPALQKLEFFFYVWIYAMPFLVLRSMGNQQLPEARPLQVMVSYLAPAAAFVDNHISSIIPENFWNSTVVGAVSGVANGLVVLRVVQRDTADWLVHAVEESRPFLVPGITVFMPWIFTQFGAIYIQYVPMISKSAAQGANCELCLKYWVLNAIANAILGRFADILWWIPLSSHAILVMWCYVSLPRSIESIYGSLEDEVVSLVETKQFEDLNNTRLGKFVAYLLKILPKASDATGNNKGAAAESQHNEGSLGSNAGESSRSGEEEDDDEDFVPSPSREKMATTTRPATRSLCS